jgi:renalase
LTFPSKTAVNDELKHFVAVNGSSAVVKHFLKEALNTKVDFNETIESLTVTEDKKRWCVKTKEGKSEEFPCVILTMPVPQILQLQGDIRDLISSPGCEVNSMIRGTVNG